MYKKLSLALQNIYNQDPTSSILVLFSSLSSRLTLFSYLVSRRLTYVPKTTPGFDSDPDP